MGIPRVLMRSSVICCFFSCRTSFQLYDGATSGDVWVKPLYDAEIEELIKAVGPSVAVGKRRDVARARILHLAVVGRTRST